MGSFLLCILLVALLPPYASSSYSQRQTRQTGEGTANRTDVVSLPPISLGEIPRVMIEDTPPTHTLGSRLSVFCTAAGLPLPTVQWRRGDGSHLPSCASDVSGTLVVDSFSRDCEGEFTCAAANQHGRDNDTIVLTGVDPTPAPTAPPCDFRCGVTEEALCVVGSAVCNGSSECPNGADEAGCGGRAETACQPDQLECRAAGAGGGGAPTCVFGGRLCDGIRDCSDGQDEEDCTASRGSPCPAGQFACTDSSSSPCIPLRQRCDGVHQCQSLRDERGCERPRGFSGPTRGPIDVTIGGHVTLTCSSGGVPAPFVTWRKNCQPLPKDGRYRVVSSKGRGQLMIGNVTLSDSGTYSCEMVTTFGRAIIGRPTSIVVQDPLAYQCEDLDGIRYERNTKYFLRKTVRSGRGEMDAADIVFIMDESGSMIQEHRWAATVAGKLDRALRDMGIGDTVVPNRFGLVGFSRNSDAHRGGVLIQQLASAAIFSASTRKLRLSGVYEDGYSGIEVALRLMKARPTATKLAILVTDEDRDVLNFGLDKEGVERLLQRAGFKLTVLVQQSYGGDHFGEPVVAPVMGIDSAHKAYVLSTDNTNGYVVRQRGFPLGESGFGTTYGDYVDLALRSGGTAWDLRMVREGEPVLTAFTSAFVHVLAEGILSTEEKCFACDCVLPAPNCVSSETALEACKGAVNPLPRPPYVCVNPSVVSAEANRTINFFCDIQTSDTTDKRKSITWTFPEGANPVILANGLTLRVVGVTRSAVGAYGCTVLTERGLNVSAAARVGFAATPEGDTANRNLLAEAAVSLSAKAVSAAVGDMVHLDCSVSGFPTPRVAWARTNGQPLPRNSLETQEKGKHVWTLSLNVVSDVYFGEYKCSAENFLTRSEQIVTVEKV